jgi:hypothetical protein
MKKYFCLLVLATMLNCSSDDAYESLKSDEPITIAAATASSMTLFGGAIGNVNQASGKISFLKDQKVVLKVFNSILKKSDIAANLTRLELDQSDGVYYLKGYGSDYQSTMLLVKDGSGNLQSAGVSCTTTACAHTTGCSVTVGGTCSKCDGDCKKTTTSEEPD